MNQRFRTLALVAALAALPLLAVACSQAPTAPAPSAPTRSIVAAPDSTDVKPNSDPVPPPEKQDTTGRGGGWGSGN